ncbi:MAG: homocysteine S-methyltransferase family protein [Patescibacteria group bacterium]
MRKRGILQRLQTGTVLGAEGYLFELERRGYIKAGAYVPEVVLDHPDALRQLHREFLRAGSEVMEAFTYYAHRSKLRVIGREDELESMNRQALRIAKEVAKEGDALVAGNICNTWEYDHKDKKRTAQIVREMYEEQVQWAVEEGVDFFIAETIEYVEEALIALEVIKKYKLPAMVTLGATYERSKDDYDWIEGCKMLEANGADIVGFNCIRGPKTMLPLLKKLRKNVNCYIAAQPVPYHTTSALPAFQFLKYKKKNAYPIEIDRFLCTRSEMATFAKQAKDLGVNYIGICCGAAPHHVRAMAEALDRDVPASRYSPDMSQHGLLGSDKVVGKHEKKHLRKWK